MYLGCGVHKVCFVGGQFAENTFDDGCFPSPGGDLLGN